MRRLGIDVGGTFTDVILYNDATGQIDAAKVPTSRDDPAIGAGAGLLEILRQAGIGGESIDFIGHGTTIATNLLIEGKGAKTALIATRGFRDLLEIRRVSRHDRADLYDLFFTNPTPLVPRRRCLEVTERTLFDGTMAVPLDLTELDTLLTDADRDGIEAVAICLLNAHVNPDHESRAVARDRKSCPDLFFTASHEVNPEIHEYERTSTTVINATLGPHCVGYIAAVGEHFAEAHVTADIHFMQSNGGLAKPASIAQRPVALLESGPAGGVTAAVALCRRLGIPHAITGDMGGTSFDVSVIRDFRPQVRHQTMLNSHAVRVPTLDIESIGAGGGSIAWVDAGGGLRIGPESAGAEPGPACYGRGGDRPTVTDCNLVLGYVDPGRALGGTVDLDADAARRAISNHLAEPFGMEVVQAVQAVRSLANALMAQAVRLVTVERGHDPRDCVYIPFGGAGPVHAVDLARELDLSRIVVPPLPGLFSACGMLIADMRHDLQAPINGVIDELDPAAIEARFATLEEEARAHMAAAGVADGDVILTRGVDCSYLAQAETIAIECGGRVDTETLQRLAQDFAIDHKRLWNFDQPGRPILLANLRIQATGSLGGFATGADDEGDAILPDATGVREVFLHGRFSKLACYDRESIGGGAAITGPAVIEEASSSIVLDAGQSARTDGAGNLIIDLEEAA